MVPRLSTVRQRGAVIMMEVHAPSMRRHVERKERGSDPHSSQPILHDGESVDYRLDSVEIAFSDGAKVGVGELLVTSKRVLWLGVGDSAEKAYDFDVPFIILHAISRDPDSYPVPCLYCQLDVDEEGEDDEEESSEVYFIPPRDEDLDAIFEAFSKAALQNPDLDMEEDSDEGSSNIAGEERGITETSTGFFCNTDEIQPGSKEAAILDHLDSVFQE